MAGLVILTVCALAAAAVTGWKMRRLKKDIYQFSDSLEKNLDNLIWGREVVSIDANQDTLPGKINEKLQRAAHIRTQKESEIEDEKKMMAELISDISHQTKTPIANQKMYLEILEQECMSPKSRELLAKLEGQTMKLDFLLQSMVKTSRLETGTIRVRRQDTDLGLTLQHAVETIVPAASQKEIKLFADWQDGFELLHDRKWTEEAVFNILDNAVKYTPEGGSISIKVVRQEIFTKISIKDSGKGIAADRQAQIFTRFYREPEVHNQSGIGIGLYLARKIIELQGGYIEVHSELGKGSEFQVYLPNG